MTDVPLHRRAWRPPASDDAPAEGGARTNALTIEDLPFTRTLVFAPHPDDESIGSGALLAAAATRDAEIRVVFMTDGGNNPWPQRVARRRWRVGVEDDKRWGRLRRIEARHALTELGVNPSKATFLGLPDDGLSALAREQLIEPIRSTIVEFNPTLLVIPSIDDFHGDHRSTHRAILKALAVSGSKRPALILSYIVHGHATAAYRSFSAGSDEIARKRAAIGCHSSQLLLSRGRFTRYAARAEQYAVIASLSVREEMAAATLMAKLRHVVSLCW